MKGKLLFIVLFYFFLAGASGQQLYVDFEANKMVRFGKQTGNLTPVVANPDPDKENSSPNCAKYIRDSAFYDNIVFYPDTLLENVTAFTSDLSSSPKISIKLYTTAAIGTTVLLQLGKKTDDTYPSGIYCEFIHHTTLQNEWENVTFSFYQIPPGSLTGANQIDKIVLLFDPASHSRDTIYFDDLAGPALLTNEPSVAERELSSGPTVKLFQNSPNPVRNNTKINFQLQTSGFVSLQLFDVLGNPVSTLLNKNLKAGIYSIPVEIESIPNGIYFYVLKTEEDSKSMRMIVSK